MKRHIGKLINTDQRCVVVYMQIPGREDHALVVPTDTLPQRYEQALMEVLESPEGQNDETLANVLHRRLMPDSGKNVLQVLHETHLLVPIPVANIVMMPRPNMPFPLAEVLASMGRTVPGAASLAETEKYNQHTVNRTVMTSENSAGIARNLIIEAELLESDARRKREQAYKIAPEMAPQTVTSDTVEEGPAETMEASVKPKRTARAKKPA